MAELTRYKLSDLYELSSGISTKPEQAGHGYPFCSFSTVFNNAFLPEELPDLMDTSDQERITYSIKAGDVFLTRTSETVDELGMSSVAVRDYSNATFSGFLKRLRPKSDKAYPKYMALFFRGEYFRKTVTNKAVMTLRASFNEDTFNDIHVDLPSMDIQRYVGDLFYDIECHSRNNNAICSNLEAMAKLLYDYWFVQFDFPDENGNPYKSSGGKMVWNDELKREIPAGWEVTNIGSITRCRDSERIPVANKDRERMKGDIPYYGATGIMGYVNEAIFSGDFVLMAEDGSVMDGEGHPIIQRVSGDVWVNNHAHVLEPIKGYSCRLLMMVLKDIPVVKIKTGSIQMKINQENMNAYKIVDIPDFLIQAINERLNVIDEKLLELEEENQQLASLRDFLLPMLMNGQVKVG